MHLASGANKNHMGTNHNRILTRENLVNNTTIINTLFHYNRLQIMDAIIINETNPSINKQYTGTQRILKFLSSGSGIIFHSNFPPQKLYIFSST